MPGLQKIAENVFVLKGSPNTGIILDPHTSRVAVVDPGIGEGRGDAIVEVITSISGGNPVVVLTHGHTDHLAAVLDLMEKFKPPVYAPRHCVGLVEDTVVRRLSVYGGLVSERLAAMPMVSFRVDYPYSSGNPIPVGMKAVSLPGHSPGHSGLEVVEKGVVFAGDAVLGERVLERFGIPFGMDLKAMLESVKKLEAYASKGYTIVPGHGPIVSGTRALQLLRANAKAIEKARDEALAVLEEKPLTLEALTVKLTERLAKTEITPRQVLLNRTAVSSLLAWLESEGLVEAQVSAEGVLWRASRPG